MNQKSQMADPETIARASMQRPVERSLLSRMLRRWKEEWKRDMDFRNDVIMYAVAVPLMALLLLILTLVP